jgi:hypothetical protein
MRGAGRARHARNSAVHRWSVSHPGAKKFFRIFFSNIQHNRKESIRPA